MSVETVDPTPSFEEPLGRMEAIGDPGSFRPDPCDPGSGACTGRATVDGHPVLLFACDHLRAGGALGESGCGQIAATVHRAVREGLPVVGIWHSAGARLQDGTSSLHAVGLVFHALVAAAGRVPVVSVVLGAAAGGAAYGPALTDFVITGPQGRVFVTGPDIVRQVTGEDVHAEALGGPDLHARRSGVVHLAEATDADALGRARQLVQLLTGRGAGREPVPGDAAAVLPASPRLVYDMRVLAARLLDDDHVVELRPRWAPNVVTALGRLDGRTVGLLANNPWHLGGCLDCAASEKAAAFVETCDAHRVPLVVLVDVPGYMPGTEQESGGIVMRGARLLTAFSRARVPRVTVIVRKAYGGAFIAMNSRALGATAVYAWPTAEVGVMYPSTAVGILHRRVLAHTPPSRRDRRVARLARAYEESAGGLARALREGHVDEVVEPGRTREVVRAALDRAATGALHAVP